MELAYVLFGGKQQVEAQRRLDNLLLEFEEKAPLSLAFLSLKRMKAFFLIRQFRWREAQPILEALLPRSLELLGPSASFNMDTECLLGWAYEHQGLTSEAARMYTNLTPRWVHGRIIWIGRCA